MCKKVFAILDNKFGSNILGYFTRRENADRYALMHGDYHVVDLRCMDNDELLYNKIIYHVSMHFKKDEWSGIWEIPNKMQDYNYRLSAETYVSERQNAPAVLCPSDKSITVMIPWIPCESNWTIDDQKERIIEEGKGLLKEYLQFCNYSPSFENGNAFNVKKMEDVVNKENEEDKQL